MESQKLSRLLEVSRILTATLELEDLLRIIMEEATRVVEAEASSLLLLDEEKGELIFDLALGEKGEKLKEIRLKLGEGVAGWVAQSGEPLLINDVEKDSRFSPKADKATQFKTKSILCVPLKIRDRIIGVLEAINKKGEAGFHAEDRELLEAFSSQASVSIENARLFTNLRQEKEKIEAVYEGMADGALTTDKDFRILIYNTSVKRFLTPEKGKSLFESIPEFRCSSSPENISMADEITFELARREGKPFFIRVKSTRLKDANSETVGFVMVLRDITFEKKEEMLKRDFLSTISHKLRTPLVSIIGYIPFLKEKVKDDFSKKALNTIERQGLYLSSLVDKLLRFTELESKTLKLHKSPTRMKELIEESLGFLPRKISMEKTNIVIDKSVEDAPPLVVDRARMREVFDNLIENAVKFNTKEKKEVAILMEEGEDFYRIVIRDNGPGIPPEEGEKIFEKFYQVEDYFTGQVEGVGLGLSLVKQVIEAHQGKVWVEDNKGEGNKVIFTIPKDAD